MHREAGAIERESGFPPVKRAAFVYVTLGLIQRGMSLLLLPFVTRAMSVPEYGAVSLLTAGAALLNIVLSLAAEPTVVSASVRAKTDPEEFALLRAARGALLYGSPIAGIVLASICLLVGQPIFGVSADLWALEILAMGIAVFAMTYALPRLRVHLRLRAFVAVSAVTILSGLVAKIALVIVLHLGPFGWALSDLIAAVAATAAALAVLTKDHLGKGPARIGQLMRLSLPLLPHLGALWIIGSIRLPLIEATLSLHDVGLFAAASSAASLIMMVALEVNRATSVEYAQDQFPAPSPRSAGAMRLQLSASTALVVALCALAPVYVTVFLPPDFAGIEPVIALLGPATVFWTVYAVTTTYTTMTARIVHLTWIPSLCGALVTIVGTLWLGALWGILGAAVAAVLAQVAMAAMALLIQSRLRLRLNWRAGGVTVWRTISAATTISLAVVPTVMGWEFVYWLCAVLVALAISGIDLARSILPPRRDRSA